MAAGELNLWTLASLFYSCLADERTWLTSARPPFLAVKRNKDAARRRDERAITKASRGAAPAPRPNRCDLRRRGQVSMESSRPLR